MIQWNVLNKQSGKRMPDPEAMSLQPKAYASKNRYGKGMKSISTMLAALMASFVFLAVLSSAAQIPTSAPATSSSNQSPALNSAQTPSLDTFNGSGAVDKLVPGVVQLSLLDAMDRGLKHNLGLLLSHQQSELARAQYRRQLSALLPNVSGNASESVNQINLAAFGIPLPAGLKSPVVGPFGVFDAHATMNETFLDFNAINKVRAAAENEKAAKFNVQDARELVVLLVGNQYLLTVASASRLETAKAQLTTAETIFQ